MRNVSYRGLKCEDECRRVVGGMNAQGESTSGSVGRNYFEGFLDWFPSKLSLSRVEEVKTRRAAGAEL